MAQRERTGRVTAKKAALGGALAAGVVGLWAGPAAAAWPSTPPNPITPFPPTATSIDVAWYRQGDASIDASEIDWYTFVSPKTGEHVFSATTPSSGLDPVIGVYDSSGNRLAYNDDSSVVGGLDSYVGVNLAQGVQYYFGVTNWEGSSAQGAYTWSVRAPK